MSSNQQPSMNMPPLATTTFSGIRREMPKLELNKRYCKYQITELHEEHWYPVEIPANTKYFIYLLLPPTNTTPAQLLSAAFAEIFVAKMTTSPIPGGPPHGSSVAHGVGGFSMEYSTDGTKDTYFLRIMERNGDDITSVPYEIAIVTSPVGMLPPCE